MHELCQKVQSQSEHIAGLDNHLQQLRGELLLREENYNKTFANGGAGERTLSVNKAISAQQDVRDWMLKGSIEKSKPSHVYLRDSAAAQQPLSARKA